tara:strand:+ start:208 stop:348 length:141 start_codon:yes stop_codon:yes gene_type:complete
MVKKQGRRIAKKGAINPAIVTIIIIFLTVALVALIIKTYGGLDLFK